MVRNFKIALTSLVGTCLLMTGCAPSFQQIKLREADTTIPDNYGLAKPANEVKEPAPSAPTETKAPSSNVNSASPTKADADTDAKTPNAEAKKPTPTTSANLDWKDFFKDPALTGLIDVALKKNQELSIQEQEVLISQNEIMSRQGEYLPKLKMGAAGGIEKVGKYTSQGASDAANGVAENLPNLLLGFSASWELDIWKKLRNATKAALFQYLATVEGRNFMVTRLVAEIAESYYELMALRQKVDILNQNIAIQQQALDIVRLQKNAARVTELPVKRFEAEVLKNKSRQYALKQSIIEKENQINFLSGRFPQHLELGNANFIKMTPTGVQDGIPSQLLENRPDVKKAEFELKAAKLDVEVAKARFYPSFSIEAGVGYQSFNAKYFFATPDSLLYNLGANLTVPLLNRKGIEADYNSAGSKQLQAVFNFERTILTAYTEVANQLNSVENLRNTFQLKALQVDALNDSIVISDTLFRAARCDYMDVLLTRRDALEAQMELVEVKQQQFSAVVNLYKALGGGWQKNQPLGPP